MYDNRSCGGILCSFSNLVTLNRDPDGFQGLDFFCIFLGRIFVVEGDVDCLEATGFGINGSADCFGYGVEVFDSAEDHLCAFRESTFIGFDMDGHLCLLGKVRIGQIGIEAAGANSYGVVKDSCGIGGNCCLFIYVFVFVIFRIGFGISVSLFTDTFCCCFRGCSGSSGSICSCSFSAVFRRCFRRGCGFCGSFFGRIFGSGFYCTVRGAFICFSFLRIRLFQNCTNLGDIILLIFFRKNDLRSIVLIPVNLSHVEVKGQPAGHFFACPGWLSFFIICVSILFDGIGAEGEDQISPFVLAAVFIIDLFCPDHSTDKLLAVPFQFFAGEPFAFNRFQTKIGGMTLWICDLKVVIIYVLRGNTVLTVVDCLDLFICQMKCIREAVSGYVVGRVDSVFGERIAQVYTDEIFRIQLRILVSFVPVCDGRAVLNFLIFRNVMVVNAGAAVQDSVKIQSILFRDIGIPVFCIFICGKTGRERGSGFFPFLAAVFIFFTVLVNIIGSGVGIVLVRAFILYVSISICFIL